MKRLPALVRTALAVLAGLLLAGALAAPATAEAPHSTPAPTPFYNSAEGEDGCTLFETAGEAAWPVFYPVPDAVAITGKASIGVGVPPGTPCLPVVPANRQIEFTGHVNDWPAVEHAVPMPSGTQESEYAFDLEAPDGAEIEYVTMRICKERLPDGSDWSGRCGENVLIERGGAAEEEPYCEFSVAVIGDLGSWYVIRMTITAVWPIHDWHVLITLPTGQQSIRSGDVSGDDTVQFEFTVPGNSWPPSHIETWANGSRCAEV